MRHTSLMLAAAVIVLLTAAGIAATLGTADIRIDAAIPAPPPGWPPKSPPVPPAASPPAARDALLAILLARPLFAAGRAPAPAATMPTRDEAPLPRLTAIVAATGIRRAIFAARGAGRAITAGVGDPLGPFRIVSIGADAVELDGREGRRLLRLEPDQLFRSTFVGPPPVVPLIDPARREAETENDQ